MWTKAGAPCVRRDSRLQEALGHASQPHPERSLVGDDTPTPGPEGSGATGAAPAHHQAPSSGHRLVQEALLHLRRPQTQVQTQ